MKNNKLLNRIELNPKIMFGKPVVKGTRLTVELILEKMAAGESENDILESYPFLTKDDLKACLLYAARSISFEEVI